MGGSARIIEPSAELALAIATRSTGLLPREVSRFTTGARHYVYEVKFEDREPVVVRIGDETAHAEMAGAVYLSGLLRPRGVPLPRIIDIDVESGLPWMVLERLPGGDLGEVIQRLSDAQLDVIAAKVASAQKIVSETDTAGRYGYAVLPEQAPYTRWSEVLVSHLDRSRRRIASAGLFDVALADTAQIELVRMRDALDAIRAAPFLHDTTTKNVIVTNDGVVSGIVDVDDLCFGDPRYPVALTLAVLTAYGGPTQYISAWLHHAAMTDDRVFRLYVALFLLDLMGEHGQTFNGNERMSSPHARDALQGAFASTLDALRA